VIEWRPIYWRLFDRLRPIPIPPRPPETPWIVGSTFPPFSLEEYDYLEPAHLLYRVSPADGAAHVLDWGGSVLVLLNDAGDPLASFDVEDYRPYFDHPRVWGIELGNELNLPYKRDPRSVNAFYLEAVDELRAAGYQGRIVTGGIMNLNDETLRWARKTIKGLPGDVIFGWHGYDDWRDQLEKLHGILNARRHAMTECGVWIEDEAIAAHLIHTGITQIYNAGSLCYVHYQTHDGAPNTELNSFGLREYSGAWRDQIIAVLRQWSLPPTSEVYVSARPD